MCRKNCAGGGVLLVAVGRAEQYAVPGEVGHGLRRVVAPHHHEAPLRGQAVLARQRCDRLDVEAQPRRIGLDDGPLADHHVEAVGGERVERLAEPHRHLATEGFAEEGGEFLVVALRVALHAGAGELLCEWIHHRQPERGGGRGRRRGDRGRHEHGDAERAAASESHDFLSSTMTRPFWTSR